MTINRYPVSRHLWMCSHGDIISQAKQGQARYLPMGMVISRRQYMLYPANNKYTIDSSLGSPSVDMQVGGANIGTYQEKYGFLMRYDMKG